MFGGTIISMQRNRCHHLHKVGLDGICLILIYRQITSGAVLVRSEDGRAFICHGDVARRREREPATALDRIQYCCKISGRTVAWLWQISLVSFDYRVKPGPSKIVHDAGARIFDS